MRGGGGDLTRIPRNSFAVTSIGFVILNFDCELLHGLRVSSRLQLSYCLHKPNMVAGQASQFYYGSIFKGSIGGCTMVQCCSKLMVFLYFFIPTPTYSNLGWVTNYNRGFHIKLLYSIPSFRIPSILRIPLKTDIAVCILQDVSCSLTES